MVLLLYDESERLEVEANKKKKKLAAATGKKPGFVELDEIEPASLTIPSVHLPLNAN